MRQVGPLFEVHDVKNCALARSTFVSENAQSTSVSDSFVNFRSVTQIGVSCGDQRINQVKECTLHVSVGPVCTLPMFSQSVMQSVSQYEGV